MDKEERHTRRTLHEPGVGGDVARLRPVFSVVPAQRRPAGTALVVGRGAIQNVVGKGGRVFEIGLIAGGLGGGWRVAGGGWGVGGGSTEARTNSRNT